LTLDTVRRLVPDLTERTVYLSGPNAMVADTARLLRRAGVRRIVTDYFSGY
jgi:NAD(P)H-flavin reductase